MIGFAPRLRLSLVSLGFRRALALPDVDAVVAREEEGVSIRSASGVVRVPDSHEASTVAASARGEIVAWVPRGSRFVRAFSRADGATVEAQSDAASAPSTMAISKAKGFVVAGGYAWTRAHEAHRDARIAYEMGAPYLYGELRPEVPPAPPFEPGVVAVYTLPKLELAGVWRGAKETIVRVAVDARGHAFASWDAAGDVRLHTSRGAEPSWSARSGDAPARWVAAAALASGGAVVTWVDASGMYRRDATRGVRRVTSFDDMGFGPAAMSVASRVVARACEETIGFYALDTGALIGGAKLDVPVRDLEFGEDGRSLAVVTDEVVVFGALASSAPILVEVGGPRRDDAPAPPRLEPSLRTHEPAPPPLPPSPSPREPAPPPPPPSPPPREALHWATIVWKGSIDSAEFVRHGRAARIGGGDDCEVRIDAVDRAVVLVEQRGHHIYVEPIDATARVVFGGDWLRKRRFYGPQTMIVFPEAGRAPSTLILVESASQAEAFLERREFWEGGVLGAWGHVLIARASAEGAPSGAVVARPLDVHADAAWWSKRGAHVALSPARELSVHESSEAVGVALRASEAEVEAYAAELAAALEGIARVGWSTTNEGDAPARVGERAWATTKR